MSGVRKLIDFKEKVSFKTVINVILTVVLIEIIIFGCLYIARINPRDALSGLVKPTFGKPKYLYTIYAGGGLNLNRPSSTIVYNDTVYVADTNNGRIAVFNYDGKYKTQIGTDGEGNLQNPVSICLDGNKMFVADTATRKIHTFDLNGKFLGYFGQGVIQAANSIFYKNEKFFVLDSQKMKALILDKNGQEVKSFGKKGLNPGEFYFPYSIFVSDENDIYVADSNNNRIQVFNLNGKLIKVLTGQSAVDEDNYSVPRGTAFDDEGNLYTAEGLINAVSVTDKSGRVVLRFRNAEPKKDANGTPDLLNLPTSVFIDENQLLYVTEFRKSRVLVYQL